MTTAFAPLKFKKAFLKSPTQKPDFSCEKFLDFLHRTDISAILVFLPKFGCHGNCADFRKILDSMNEFVDPENLTIYAINSSIFCTELKSVQFWLIFAQIWLPW